ncbi:hypothetical protein [Rickettsiella massiliensis]|nr:hypothetical protein [Rickettsiella massiliensis]
MRGFDSHHPLQLNGVVRRLTPQAREAKGAKTQKCDIAHMAQW